MGWLLHDKTHVWAPAWEGWLTLAELVFFAWPCPSLCHSWHLLASPPSDPVHALVSWHVASLFALASRPCERHISTTLVLEWSSGGGVGGGGGECERRWRQSEGDSRTSSMCVVMCRYIWVSVWHPCLVRGKYAPLYLLLRNGMHRQVTQSLPSCSSSSESAREKGAGGLWQISLVPTDVIQQMLTLTFMSLHILSPAKFPPLYSEWVYKYRLEQWDRANTNLWSRVQARWLDLKTSPELAAEPSTDPP